MIITIVLFVWTDGSDEISEVFEAAAVIVTVWTPERSEHLWTASAVSAGELCPHRLGRCSSGPAAWVITHSICSLD